MPTPALLGLLTPAQTALKLGRNHTAERILPNAEKRSDPRILPTCSVTCERLAGTQLPTKSATILRECGTGGARHEKIDNEE